MHHLCFIKYIAPFEISATRTYLWKEFYWTWTICFVCLLSFFLSNTFEDWFKFIEGVYLTDSWKFGNPSSHKLKLSLLKELSFSYSRYASLPISNHCETNTIFNYYYNNIWWHLKYQTENIKIYILKKMGE